MKQKIILAVIGLALILGGFFVKKYIEKDFYYAGSIEVTRVDLSSRIASVIGKILYNEGDKVKKGTLLLELNCEDLKLAKKLATSNYERAELLFKSGSMPQENFDKVENKKETVDLKLSWCQIKSPIDATILTQYMDEEEWVSPGAKLIALANLKEAWTYIYVEQQMISKLKLGMKVEGLIPELSNKTFVGHIVKINDEAEFTPKNVQTRKERSRLVFGVKVMFSNEKEILKPGMSIEVKLPEEDRVN